MRSFVFTSLVVIVVVTATSVARAENYFGFKTGIVNAPAAPVVTLPQSPHFQIVARTRIYVPLEEPRNVDLFRYDGYWYAYAAGYWYRARKARETFYVTEVHNVPKAVLFVPMKHWQHHPEANFAKLTLRSGGPAKSLANKR